MKFLVGLAALAFCVASRSAVVYLIGWAIRWP